MKTLRAIAAEVAGLFVEDRFFALAIAVWLALGIAALRTHLLPATARGAVLFGGLAFILIASVARAAYDAHDARDARDAHS
jgi:hypothetical protein